jgi:hypothetical protein
MVIRRIVLVGIFCLGSPPLIAWTDNQKVVAASIIDARTRKEVLDSLAENLDTRYVIIDVARKLAATIKAKEKANAYKNITEGPELARVLTDDLFAVAHDKHLRVAYSFAPLPQGPMSAPPVELFKKLNGLIPKVEVLDGNVGYMQVNGVPMLEAAREPIAAAFAFLHNTDALIIDNRGNGGGDPNTVALYMSYLSTGPSYLVNTFHWRAGNRIEEFKTTELGNLSYGTIKPVFVLTSSGTFSGGEELSYDIQAFKRGTLVGEITGGGANPGGPVQLGHHFLVNMPGGQGINAVTGTNWEGVGVKPDVTVPAAEALIKAHELALARLVLNEADPGARRALEAIAMKVEAIAEADEIPRTARLAQEQIMGTYVLQGDPGPAVTIFQKDGQLIQHIDGFPDRSLSYVAGNRYRREGGTASGFDSFRMKDGKVQLLIEAPFDPPAIRVKQ